jgi:hypothetical protein
MHVCLKGWFPRAKIAGLTMSRFRQVREGWVVALTLEFRMMGTFTSNTIPALSQTLRALRLLCERGGLYLFSRRCISAMDLDLIQINFFVLMLTVKVGIEFIDE